MRNIYKCLCALLFATCVTTRAKLNLSMYDRVLILAPHPDDEVIACGGVIQNARELGVPVNVVFFTYGDNNEWSFLVYRRHPVFVPDAVRRMGEVRHDEACEAARILSLDATNLVFLGYPDFGTLHVWASHWNEQPPFESMLTRVTSVPYDNAFRPGAPYKGEAVLNDLKRILLAFRPTKVFVSHPSDFNADHLALYLFARVALWDLATELSPEIYPYLVHYKKWPFPRGRHPDDALEPPFALLDSIAWVRSPVTATAEKTKESAIEAHRSQLEYSRAYLLSFIRKNELFGDYPPINLRVAEFREESAPEESPEQLTDEERAILVGFEERSARLTGDSIEISLHISKPLARTMEAMVYLFGYRADKPFGGMPKIRVRVGGLGETAYDQDLVLPASAATIERTSREITVRVALKTLGNPEKILTSARTYLGEVPLDSLSWRVLELSEPGPTPDGGHTGAPAAATP